MAATATLASIPLNGNSRSGRQQHQQQQSTLWSFRSFSIGFFIGLLCFAVMTVYVSESSIRLQKYKEEQQEVVHLDQQQQKDSYRNNNGIEYGSRNDATKNTLAGLSCTAHGGPANELAQEMVYWKDIPSDSHYISPMKPKDGTEQYLTFEPDQGGWNNIRMAMETVLAIAAATGRTLVLPPEAEMYLLKKNTHEKSGSQQQNTFTFNNFFHMDRIHEEFIGLNIITMEEYLQSVAMKGYMKLHETNKVSFPPKNRTKWDGRSDISTLYRWLRSVSYVKIAPPEQCLFVLPTSHDPNDIIELQQMENEIRQQRPPPKYEDYIDKPVAIDGTTIERMKENWAGRQQLCIYDSDMQSSTYLHFPVDHALNARLLVHFYAFVFLQNWKHDLWLKRFVRDHVRYADDIQCAAARVVAAVRNHARLKDPVNNPNGDFDAFHVRRGDFQYKSTRVDAKEIYKMAQRKIPDGSTVFIATDERDKKFFQPMIDHYDVVFLDDFHDEALVGINSNYYGMIDQLVTTRSRIFYGCWFSTFTGYINRIRGYHAENEKRPGYENGIIDSWYYTLEDRFDHMRHYYPVKQSYYAREFPTSWRLIDTTLETS